jgi:hypothetical protein
MWYNTAFIILFPAQKLFYYIIPCNDRGIRNKCQYLKGTLLPHVMESVAALKLQQLLSEDRKEE